jgi:hypothetical protein
MNCCAGVRNNIGIVDRRTLKPHHQVTIKRVTSISFSYGTIGVYRYFLVSQVNTRVCVDARRVAAYIAAPQVACGSVWAYHSPQWCPTVHLLKHGECFSLCYINSQTILTTAGVAGLTNYFHSTCPKLFIAQEIFDNRASDDEMEKLGLRITETLRRDLREIELFHQNLPSSSRKWTSEPGIQSISSHSYCQAPLQFLLEIQALLLILRKSAGQSGMSTLWFAQTSTSSAESSRLEDTPGFWRFLLWWSHYSRNLLRAPGSKHGWFQIKNKIIYILQICNSIYIQRLSLELFLEETFHRAILSMQLSQSYRW